jgi:hypothetical protein
MYPIGHPAPSPPLHHAHQAWFPLLAFKKREAGTACRADFEIFSQCSWSKIANFLPLLLVTAMISISNESLPPPVSEHQNCASSALHHNVISRCSTTQARVCKLSLPHYTCDTPMFMPVGTCGAVKGMTTEELEELDCHLILGNTYHLALRPGTGFSPMNLFRNRSWALSLLCVQIFSKRSVGCMNS